MPVRPEVEALRLLAQHGSHAFDRVILSDHSDSSMHEKCQKGLKAALEMLIANKLITVVPREDWPEYVYLDPPYELPGMDIR